MKADQAISKISSGVVSCAAAYFCTNMQRASIDVKSLQNLMGHFNISVTLDVYTNINYDAVQEAFARAVASM